MADPILTPEQIRAQKLAIIEGINRRLDSSATEIRDASGRFKKTDVASLFRRRDELLAEIGALDDPGTGFGRPTGHIRQVRMIGRKGL